MALRVLLCRHTFEFGRCANHPAQVRRVLRDKKRSPRRRLRHSYATHLIKAGVDLLEVKKILGHHSILTTAKHTLSTATQHNAQADINALMNGFSIVLGTAK